MNYVISKGRLLVNIPYVATFLWCTAWLLLGSFSFWVFEQIDLLRVGEQTVLFNRWYIPWGNPLEATSLPDYNVLGDALLLSSRDGLYVARSLTFTVVLMLGYFFSERLLGKSLLLWIMGFMFTSIGMIATSFNVYTPVMQTFGAWLYMVNFGIIAVGMIKMHRPLDEYRVERREVRAQKRAVKTERERVRLLARQAKLKQKLKLLDEETGPLDLTGMAVA